MDNEDFLEEEPGHLEEAEPGHNLKPKQRRFCMEYLKDYNVSAAARRAGFSPTSAFAAGQRIMKLPEVDAYLKFALNNQLQEMQHAPQVSYRRLVAVSNLEPGDFLDKNGDIKNVMDLPDELRPAVHVQTKRISKDENGTTVTTYTLVNKIRLLEKISHQPATKKEAAVNTESDERNFAIMPDGTEREF